MRNLIRMVPVLSLVLTPLSAWAGGQGYSNEQAIQVGDQLSQQLNIAPDKRTVIHDRLVNWMTENRTRKFGDTPITGVFAYRLGEGGLIIKITEGKGLLRYHGEEKEHHLKLSSVSAGAQAGGSAEYGVGIVFGANAPMTFGGEYRLTQVAATAGSGGTSNAELSKGGADRIILLGTATGFSASAAGGELKIKVVH